MRNFIDRHFVSIERYASLAGAFGMGGLALRGVNGALIAFVLIMTMAFTKLYLLGWFKYEGIGVGPYKSKPVPPGPIDELV